MKFNTNWKINRNLKSKVFLDIVSDASITSKHIGNGKTIPLVIVDTTKYKDIEQSILLQNGSSDGRVGTIWGKRLDSKFVTLTINLMEPSQVEFSLIFNVEKHGGLIDLIINSQLLYIQPGSQKDRLSTSMDNKRLLIEVPSTHFKSEWNYIFCKIMRKHFRKLGLSNKQANAAVESLRNEWGIIRDFRMK